MAHLDETWEREEFRDRHLNVGMHFKNLQTFPVHRRPTRGSSSAHFSLSDNKTVDAHVSELAPGGHNNMHRHRNEAIIYILSGRGYTILQDGGAPPMRVDWEEGDILSPPLNWWHQHFNADPERPARYLAITNVPLMTGMGIFTKEQRKK